MPAIIGLDIGQLTTYIILVVLFLMLLSSTIESSRQAPKIESDPEEEKDQKQEFVAVAKLRK